MSSQEIKITNPSVLSRCLKILTEPNNNVRKPVEKALKEFCKSPNSLIALTDQIKDSDSFEVRQVAAVLLRIIINRFWDPENENDTNTINQKQKLYIKNNLLQKILKEKEYIVRRSIIFCIGEIAYFEIEEDENLWPELLGYVQNSVNSKNFSIVLNGIMLFGVLLENVGEVMIKDLATANFISNIFLKYMGNNNKVLLRSLLNAILFLAMSVRESKSDPLLVVKFSTSLLNIISKYVKSQGDSDIVHLCFEIFKELAVLKSDKREFLETIPHVCSFMVKIGLDTGIDDEIRNNAGTYIAWIIEMHTHIVFKNKLLSPIMEMTLKLLTTPIGKDVDEEDDISCLYRCGSFVLDIITQKMPPVVIYKQLVGIAMNLINNNNNNNNSLILGGVTILGIVAEGCVKFVKKDLGTFIVTLVKNFERTQNMHVKKYVVVGFLNYLLYCSPDVYNYYAHILSLLSKSMFDVNDAVKKRSVFCIGLFFEGMIKKKREQVYSYAKKLFNNLLQLFQNAKMDVKIEAVSSMGKIIRFMRGRLDNDFIKINDVVKYILQNKSNCPSELVATAVECLGFIAISMGRQKFLPLVDSFMNNIINLIKQSKNEPDILESCFQCISSYAKTIGENFTKFSKIVIEIIDQALLIPDGSLSLSNSIGGSFLHDNNTNNNNNNDVSQNVGELKGLGYDFKLNKSVLQMKCEALRCIGIISKAIGTKFSSFFIQEFNKVKIYCDSKISSNIRNSAASALGRIVCSVVPKPIPTTSANHQMDKYFGQVFQIYCNAINRELFKSKVAEIFDCIIEVCKSVGLFGLRSSYNSVCLSLVRVLKRETKCFLLEDSKMIGSGVEVNYDSHIFEPLMKCFEIVATIGGVNFENTLKTIFPILIRYIKGKNADEREIVIGSLSDFSKGLGKNICKYANEFLPLILNVMEKDEEEEVRNNCVYLVGCLVQIEKKLFEKSIGRVLQMLYSILQNSNKFDSPILDNCCTTFSKVILNINLPQDHLSRLLPCFFSNLPLKEDEEEWTFVSSALVKLLSNNFSITSKYMNFILKSFAVCFRLKSFPNKMKENIVNLLKAINSKFPQAIQTGLGALDQNDQRSFLKILNYKGPK